MTPATCSDREKNGRIELRAFLGKDPVTGKAKYRSKSIDKCGVRALAQAKKEFLDEIAEEGDVFTTAETFGALIDAWMRQGATRWSPSTVRGYRSKIEHDIRPALGDIPLNKLKTKTLDDFYRKLLERLSPKSIRQIHAICRAALKQAVRWDWLAVNPADNTNPPSVPKAIHRPPDVALMAKAIREYAEIDADMTTLWWISASLGSRRGEAFGLRWRDVDLDKGEILVHRNVVVGSDLAGNLTTVEKGTKTHQARRIEIDEATVAILKAHRLRCIERAVEAKGGVVPGHYADVAPEAFVFSPDASGKSHYQDPNRATKAWRRWADKKGLEGVRLHDLRHVAATALLNAGVPITTVSQRLGHANVSTTLNIYSHAVPGSGRDAASKMGELMKGDD